MTNFEKIKSMTEEEFANFLCRSVIPEDTDEDMYLHGFGTFTYEEDIVQMIIINRKYRRVH